MVKFGPDLNGEIISKRWQDPIATVPLKALSDQL